MANPNPSPATRFKKGNVANPGGKTKKQKKMEQEAAQMAAALRHKALSAMLEKLDQGEDVLELVDANALKLFKDSEDRAHGTPKATTEHSGPDGAPIAVKQVEYTIFDPVDED